MFLSFKHSNIYILFHLMTIDKPSFQPFLLYRLAVNPMISTLRIYLLNPTGLFIELFLSDEFIQLTIAKVFYVIVFLMLPDTH